MRFIVLTAVLATALTLNSGEVQAQQYRQNGIVYVYPPGTPAYYAGPYGRSDSYIMPTVTRGFQYGTNVPVNNNYQPMPNGYYQQPNPYVRSYQYGNYLRQYYNR